MSNYEAENNINNSQDLMNYIDQENIQSNNTSVERSNELKINNQNVNKNKNGNPPNINQEEILSMELKNVQMLILQRSLYILKKKFEINKKELQIIYQKYRDENYMQLKCINVDYLYELYKEILDTTQFTMLPYTNFNELITADLMTELNDGKSKAVLKALVKFSVNNIEKYNRIYFEKKMRKKKLIEENEKKKKSTVPPPDMEEYTSQVKIVKINKRGKTIYNFEQMIENNKEFDVGENIIATINEDDMSILNNKKLLYSDVIPLIIADFLQEYLKNNEFVAIVSTSNVADDQENLNLNQNVKSLFDNDILRFYNNLNKVDPKQENKEKLKNLLFELMNIENQIKIYQNLIIEKTTKGANVKHLMNMVKKLNEQQSILQKKVNQFSLSSKKRASNAVDLSIMNSNATNSVFRSSGEKYNSSKKEKSSDKNNLIKIEISNSKSNKSIKTVKNSKYKLASNSSKNSVNSKKVLSPNNANNNNLNNIYKNSNTANLNSNNNLIIDVYGANSQSTNQKLNETNINNINNTENNKYNYYYNNDNFYYQHGVKYPESKEEFRENSLLEIFYFYTKQHSFIGQTPTFQEILKSEEHLDLAEFGKFCVEFKIMVKPQKIAEVFKKNAKNAKELNYANFVKTLQKLSVCANDEKKQYLMERIKICKMKLKEINEKNKKEGVSEDKNDQNKSKEKEENLSGIKSEGEAEDDKCEQEKNLENKKEGNENNNENNNENVNEKKSNHSKGTDKENDKRSKISDNNNMEKINETKEENNFDSNDENRNENQENQGDKETNRNSKEKKKKKNQSNNNNNKPITTNLKYYQQTKEKNKNKNKNMKQKKTSLVKPKTNSFLMMETKEEIQEKINKLKQDYDKLNQKTNTQLEEEFYQYLEIDDINSYRKKMVGYIIPFLNRENYSRFPIQSVSRPIKRDPKIQKEMHKILVQRHEEMKKEKELKQIKEKNILFEKRKKKFEIENKKLQQKMSMKNDYLQFKLNEEDYQKEKMNKLTWQQIQKSDYDTFIINEKDKIKNGNLDEIFTSQSNQLEGEVGDYLKNFRNKKGPNDNITESNNQNLNNNNQRNKSNTNKKNPNVYESSSKSEGVPPKFDANISRISSKVNPGNNSEYDIVNSMESNK